MTKAFCPGHITCFFRPARSYDPLSTGSCGAGIRLSKGSLVTVEERFDQRIETVMDGKPADADITRLVLRMLAPERGFDVTIDNQLPVSQGFGMSASGAIAAGLCACSIAGKKQSEAFRAAHLAEIQGGGGLGDVSALMCRCHVPVRKIAGIPPLGKVVDSGERMNMTIAVLGDPISTKDILNNREAMDRISAAGSSVAERYLIVPNVRNLFRLSREFSKAAGLETPEISEALNSLGKQNAAMCMLGNSIFSTAKNDVITECLPDALVTECVSTDEGARIIRKA